MSLLLSYYENNRQTFRFSPVLALRVLVFKFAGEITMRHNLKSGLLTLALAGFVISGSNASAQGVTITTEATLAPEPFGLSPSYGAWAANGLYAAEYGLSSYGAPGPAQFSTISSPLPTAYNLGTAFPAWQGQAYPAAPYANERGNQAEFVGIINGNGAMISINNMGASMSSSDPGDALGASFPNDSVDPGDWTYDADDIGIIFHNGVNISGGFTVVDSGSPGQLVNEIISIGLGNNYYDAEPLATRWPINNPSTLPPRLSDLMTSQAPLHTTAKAAPLRLKSSLMRRQPGCCWQAALRGWPGCAAKWLCKWLCSCDLRIERGCQWSGAKGGWNRKKNVFYGVDNFR